MNELALFSGAGGGILASRLLGWNTVCAVEIEKYPRDVLFARQRDGMLERFPIWDDVRTFDGNPWKGKIDVISGGFPCQDISSAGKGKGLAGERSGLWKQYKRIIGEIRPNFVFAENSPLLRTRGLGTILKDLDGMGYDARWCVLGAGHTGGDHKRNRMWILAYSAEMRWPKVLCSEKKRSYYKSEIWPTNDVGSYNRIEQISAYEQMAGQPAILGSDHGFPNFVDRLKAIGNGQVPIVAATAWNILTNDLHLVGN